jgi:hypothetical protein
MKKAMKTLSNPRRLCRIALTMVSALWLLPASAATIFWTNLSGGNWTTAANWSPNLAPTNLDTALILPSKTAVRRFLTCLAGWLFVLGAHAGIADDVIHSGWRGSGLEVPFYLGMEREPSAVFRAKRAYRDYERKGFFKIGVLPLAVFDGVTIEVNHTDAVINSLAEVHDWLGRDGAQRVELRQVELLIASKPPCRVDSGRVRILDNGRCRLLGGVTVTSGTNQVSAGTAVLQLTGVNAGEIAFETSPPVTNHLFFQTSIRTLTQPILARKNPG